MKLELVEFAGGVGSALCGGHLEMVEWLEVYGLDIASQSKTEPYNCINSIYIYIYIYTQYAHTHIHTQPHSA